MGLFQFETSLYFSKHAHSDQKIFKSLKTLNITLNDCQKLNIKNINNGLLTTKIIHLLALKQKFIF